MQLPAPVAQLRSMMRPVGFEAKRDALIEYGVNRTHLGLRPVRYQGWQRVGRDEELEEIAVAARHVQLCARLYPECCTDDVLGEGFELGVQSGLEAALLDRLSGQLPIYAAGERLGQFMYDPLRYERSSDVLRDLPNALAVIQVMWEFDEDGSARALVAERGGIGLNIPEFDRQVPLNARVFEAGCATHARAERRASCRRIWQSLPLLVRYIAGETLNPFLDASDEDSRELDSLPCSLRMRTLRQIQRVVDAAERLHDKVVAAGALLDAHPELWPRIFALWRLATQPRGAR